MHLRLMHCSLACLLIFCAPLPGVPIAEAEDVNQEPGTSDDIPEWISTGDYGPEGPAPRGWATYSTPQSEAEFLWDDRRARSGERSLYIRNIGPRTATWMTEIPVVPRAEYRVRVYGWAENNRGTSQISTRARDAEGQWISGAHFPSKNQEVFITETTPDWTELEARFVFPDSAERVRVMLANTLGDGDEVWFDDFEVFDNVVPSFLAGAPEILQSMEEADLNAEEEALQTQLKEHLEHLKTLSHADYAAMPVEERRELFSLLREGHDVQIRLLRQRGIEKWRDETEPVTLLWVDALERVFLDELPLPPSAGPEWTLEVFPGQREAVQLVVVADEELTGVRVEPAADGEDSFPGAIDVRVVGYVRIDEPSFNHHRQEAFPHRGWWPDPLFEMEEFEVEAGATQPVWIDVRVPREAAPGIYEIPFVVRADKAADGTSFEATRNLAVEVLPGVLPEEWHMKNILSFSARTAKEDFRDGTRFAYGDRWEEVAPAFYDLLLDSRIPPFPSLFENMDYFEPDQILEAVERGMNVLLFASISRARYDEEGNQILNQRSLRALRQLKAEFVPWLEENDLMDIAYFYCFDEHSPEYFDFAVETLRPYTGMGFKILTTMQDYSFGTETELGQVVDAFMPGMGHYDRDLARQARREGREVWWYSTQDFNIETDTVYHRLKPWRTLQEEADGYLIWTMNRWAGNPTLLQPAIRAEWNPRLDGITSSSSAMMLYPGEDGPISSIRLENYRMGIEDYDLIVGAARQLQREGESEREAIERVWEALELPEEVGELAPAELRQVRRRLAALFEADGE